MKFAKWKSNNEVLWIATGQARKESLFRVCVERFLHFIDGTGLINRLKVVKQQVGLNCVIVGFCILEYGQSN